MPDLVLEQLTRLLAQYPDAATGNVERLEALLHDFCRGQRREIALLTAAADEGVPAALRSGGAASIPSLAQQLADDRGIMSDAAHWAVETWALALGVTRARTNPQPHRDNDRGGQGVVQPQGNQLPKWLNDAIQGVEWRAHGTAAAKVTYQVFRYAFVAVGFVGYAVYLVGKKVVGAVKR
jgi:hypothetical protein